MRAILDELGIERDQLAEVALRYILSHPAVSSAIPGMRSVRNVERNAAVGDGRGLPEEQVAALEAAPLGSGTSTGSGGDELRLGRGAGRPAEPVSSNASCLGVVCRPLARIRHDSAKRPAWG